MSPIGNPQNLLIAMSGEIANPFVTFFSYLLLPTVVNLVLTFVLLRVFYKSDLQKCVITHSEEPIRDRKLASLSKLSFILIGILIIAKIVIVLLDFNVDFRLTYVALIPALLIFIFSPRRIELVRKIDWRTIVFFIAMFVLMGSVWESGFFQSIITRLDLSMTSIPSVLIVSTFLSQLISNVPLVALYLPVLTNAGASTASLMALAAGSTIAGNLLILGAASNVIIIQNAEKRFGETITFLEFARIGVIVTAVNLFVYSLFLTIGI
jgi:Na+/H+ antiporter NhaD/arsenite permease-like protein